MKLSTLIIPSLGLGLAAAILMPAQEADAWSTIGGNLDQGQRDVRVYNNFSDPSDNNNQTPDPFYPGYQGAVMAIWKGCVEWGSLHHDDGSSDPTQSFIGSGQANFDASFQGQANSTGGTNDNIHSQISGSNGGVLAYCETPISNGWRIRYYENWNWADGPGAVNGGQMDLQSVACHEYGHALGLGHSDAQPATMAPSTGSGDTGGRSITGDDRAGIQSIYGVQSGSKPVITDVSITGNQITITGTGFNSSGNQIWFTQANSGGNGTPIKVTNLNSNGTTLTANIPGSAGPGDVLVRRNSTAHNGLSNALPTDLQETPDCLVPNTYCTSSPNSVGAGAQIGHTGTASLSANDLSLTCTGLPSGAVGIFFYGNNESNSAFGDGQLCASNGIVRMNVQSADVLGTLFRDLDLGSAPFDSGSGAAISGGTKKFQFWYRDVAGGPAGFNTSNGLSVTFCD